MKQKNKFENIIKNVLLIFPVGVFSLSIFLSGVAWAQVQPRPRPNPRPIPEPIRSPIVRPNPDVPTAPINSASLGSSREVVGRYSTNLGDLIKQAMPSFDEKALGNHFQNLQKKYAQGGPGIQLEAKSLGQMFLMDIGREGSGETANGSYNINSQTGRAQITKDLFNAQLLDQEQARVMAKSIQAQHEEALRRFALGREQVFSKHMQMRFVETGKDAGEGRLEVDGKPRVEGFLTYVVRNIDGILVDGSELKLLSNDDKALAGLSVRWPKFQFHPQIKLFDLKNKGQLAEEILSHGKQVLNSKHEFNVKTAVVLRPVLVDNREFFIPALKVGIWSRPPGGGEKNVASGEAGEMFYVDLLKQTPSYVENNQRDKSE